MAYHFDTVKLEKGMYGETGRTFTQVLEAQDPSEQYKGTALEGLDAFQRQLKRFDIKVKGAGSDVVEKFFSTADSAVLFPEYVARAVRQGMEEADLLPAITAAVTRFDGMDYRSITSVPDEEKELRRVEEGAAIPSTTVKAVVDELIASGHVNGRPTIGILGYTVTADMAREAGTPTGVKVDQVQEGSDAWGKLEAGDVIVQAQGEPVEDMEQLQALKNSMQAGQALALQVWRQGEYLEITVTLVESWQLEE